MKMKHWAYIGMALIVGNASLLGGVRAAEFADQEPFFRQPTFDIFRFPRTVLWGKPHKEFQSPVTLRVFSEQKLQSISLKNSFGFQVSGHKMASPILISVQNHTLCVYSRGQRVMTRQNLAINSLD